MNLFEVSLIKKKRRVPKYTRNDSDGSGTLNKWQIIGYQIEYHINATLRAREAEEDSKDLDGQNKIRLQKPRI